MNVVHVVSGQYPIALVALTAIYFIPYHIFMDELVTLQPRPIIFFLGLAFFTLVFLTNAPLVFAAACSYTVRGQVKDQNNVPVENAIVCLDPNTNGYTCLTSFTDNTDTSGNYEIQVTNDTNSSHTVNALIQYISAGNRPGTIVGSTTQNTGKPTVSCTTQSVDLNVTFYPGQIDPNLFVRPSCLASDSSKETIYTDWLKSSGKSHEVFLIDAQNNTIETHYVECTTVSGSPTVGALTCAGNGGGSDAGLKCGLTLGATPALNTSGLKVKVNAWRECYRGGSLITKTENVPTNLSCGGAPPPPPPSGCTITASPDAGGFSGTITGPGNSYQITCPAGNTFSVDTTSGSSPYSCNNTSGTISARGFSGSVINCQTNVTVTRSCTVFNNYYVDKPPYIYTYKDTSYNNNNYSDVTSQWPQFFWCSSTGCNTYGTRGNQPISNVTTYGVNGSRCGYTEDTSGSGECRLARFGVSTNFSSAYPFNQPLSQGVIALPNVTIHADSDCGNFIAHTGPDGTATTWTNTDPTKSNNMPARVRDGGSSRSVYYDVYADVPSGRRSTRAVHFSCFGGPCVDFDGLESNNPAPGYLNPGQNRFSRWNPPVSASGTIGNNFFFGFTNPGQEPQCVRMNVDPITASTTITRGQTLSFSGMGIANGTNPTAGGGAEAKRIAGYGWDFDGNGTIDRETSTGSTDWTFNKASPINQPFQVQLFAKDNTPNPGGTPGLYSFPQVAPQPTECIKPITVKCGVLKVSPDSIIMSPGQTLTLTATGGNGNNPNMGLWTIDSNNITSDEGRIITPHSPNNLFYSNYFGSSINIYAKDEGNTGITFEEGLNTQREIDPSIEANGCPPQTIRIPVIVRTLPWFQGVGGDIRIDSGITNKVPIGVTPPSSRFTSIFGSGGTAGVIFAGDGVPPVLSPDFGQGTAPANTFASPNGWLVYGSGGKFTPVNNNIMRTSYRFMNDNIKTTITNLATNICPNLLDCTLPANFQGGVYKAEGNTRLNSYTFLTGHHYLFLINGDLRIQGTQIVPKGSTVTFISSKDIVFDKTVGGLATDTTSHVEGFYSADENIIIESYNNNCATSDKRLNVAGTLISNAGMTLTGSSFQQNRDLCTTAGTNNNTKYPALKITERPDFILNAPNFLKVPNYIWEEVAP